jgi:hypothetical protein
MLSWQDHYWGTRALQPLGRECVAEATEQWELENEVGNDGATRS